MRPAIARRYAEALLDVITSPPHCVEVERVKNELASFVETWKHCGDLRRILESPAVPRSSKDRAIGRVADVLSISPVVRNFLCVLSKRRRLSKIATIAAEFGSRSDERRGIVRAVATAASPLGPEQEHALVTALARMLGKTVQLECAIDPGLIGGVRARVNSTVYDGTVRGYLEALRRRLLASPDATP
jgi:F-type H+-transporting ATPase subunit delta